MINYNTDKNEKNAHQNYNKALEIGPNPELELVISKSPYWAYSYAKNVLKAPFHLAEPTIANSIYSINYSIYILNSRFKLAENNLNQFDNRHWEVNNSFLYTKYILKFNHE